MLNFRRSEDFIEMATDTRPGFRLPWGTDAGQADGDSGTGVPADVEEAQEPAMFETTVQSESSEADEHPVATGEPEAVETTDVQVPQPAPRRTNKFMAELSRAMQAAVETARAETMARFEAEAKSVVDEIHANATTETAELRRKADDDVASIRDWSKAEIARVREETDARIAARKAALDGEMEGHAGTIEARAERVATVVAAYEAELAAFFARLNAEEDPTRIATMAESMPEPPSLADVAASVSSASEPSAERFARVFAPIDEAPDSPGVDFAAAEAEAAAFTPELEADADLAPAPGQVEDVSEQESLLVAEDMLPAEHAMTRVVVSGLVSVANIANFKRSLGRLAGVSNIAVASGRDGDFAFTVGHNLGSALAASVRTLPGFEVEITSEHDDTIVVTARDRDGND